MKIFISILFWAGMVLLVDGSLGLLLEDKWQKIARGLNIRRLALGEIGVALGLLMLHYFLLQAKSGG